MIMKPFNGLAARGVRREIEIGPAVQLVDTPQGLLFSMHVRGTGMIDTVHSSDTCTRTRTHTLRHLQLSYWYTAIEHILLRSPSAMHGFRRGSRRARRRSIATPRR